MGIVLYERTKNIAGLVHIMLPDSTKIRQNQNKLKFADTGIQALVEELEKQGLSRKNMIAKIAGGAKMFSFLLIPQWGISERKTWKPCGKS